jgi:hypothetical protein
MTVTNCDLFTHSQSRTYLNHLVFIRKTIIFFDSKVNILTVIDHCQDL